MIAIFLNNSWFWGILRNGSFGLVLGMSFLIYLYILERTLRKKVWVLAFSRFLNVCLLKTQNICLKIFIFKIFFPIKSLFSIKDLKMSRKMSFGGYGDIISHTVKRLNEVYRIEIFFGEIRNLLFQFIFQEILSRKKSDFFQFCWNPFFCFYEKIFRNRKLFSWENYFWILQARIRTFL